jgi:hypothetical protein
MTLTSTSTSNRTLRTLTLLAALTHSGELVRAADAPEKAVKTTVAAFAGHWSFRGSVTELGSATAAPLTATMDCKSAVSGAAVACVLSAQVAGAPVSAAMLIGFNAADQRVYWMEISSTGEYHAHRGSWRGKSVEFEPLVTPAERGSSTELLEVAFPSAGTLLLKSTTTTPDGSSTIDATAHRAVRAK